MRNMMKAATLESKFPLLAVEHGCIVSKDADLTAAFEVELPEVYTVTAEEYESVHAAWCKAIKVLPDHSVLHKQDWYVKEEYRPDLGKEGMGFLARSYEMHFNERPYLNHKCYLFLTKTTKERMRRQSNWSTLCRGHIVPKEIQDRETAVKFIEAVEQFARILNDSGHVRLRRLTDDEITGTETQAGIVGRYLALSLENPDCLEDMEMSAREMRVGDKRLCLHTLSDTEDLPASVETDYRYERLSTDRSDCRLSFAAPLGLLLPCNHIYNQYIFIGNSDEELQRFEKSARNMQSLSRYSRQNAINCEWVEEYLNEAHSQGLKSVRAHFNVMAWSDDTEELKLTWEASWHQWAACRATTRWTAPRSIGRRYPATRRTSRRKSRSTRSSSRRYASLQARPTTGTRPRLSASAWQTASAASPCTSTYPTCR